MRLLNKILYASFLFLLWQLSAFGQSRYALNKLPLSSPNYDEFCPILWEDSLIYCSNQEHEFLLTYHDGQNRALFNLFMIGLEGEKKGMKPSVLSPALVTPFNDGPAALSPDGTQMAYSRNLGVKTRRRNVLKMNNHLGIYFAEQENGIWEYRGDFPYNNKEYSLTTPCFGPDGSYLYFASDMPEGNGGTDLYRSEWREGSWGEPVNLGGVINTEGNEIYPFVAENGDLYFASDGHPGLGEKDIFLTRFEGGRWMEPLHLEYPLNSENDDFGMVTNGEFSEGYLSSNREKSDDIYRFYTHIPQLFECDSQLTNNYCFEFWDEEYPGIDSLPVIYEWTFSDSTKVQGLRVSHCFPGAGLHWARLNIIDDRTDSTFYMQSSREFEITDHEQPFITSQYEGVEKAAFSFNGLNSHLPGFTTEQFIWDFGDGGFAEGAEVDHSYEEAGTYMVKLGLKGKAEGESEVQIRCVQKTVRIMGDSK